MRHIHRRHGRGQLIGTVLRWFAMVSLCLIVWGVLSPLIYESFFSDLHRGGDRWGVIGFAVCVIVPLLLVSVSSTGKVIHQTREEYFPPVITGSLPAEEVLVRDSEAPPAVQSEILLRAATGQETPKEELLQASQENKS